MNRYVYHPSSVTVVIHEHSPNCSCQQGRPGVIDLRCVAEYVVQVANEPSVAEATRPAAVAAAVGHARAAEAAIAGNRHGEARAENDMARTWALIARELPEVDETPRWSRINGEFVRSDEPSAADTAVIPRVEPGQGGDPRTWCFCEQAWDMGGAKHRPGVNGCVTR